MDRKAKQCIRSKIFSHKVEMCPYNKKLHSLQRMQRN